MTIYHFLISQQKKKNKIKIKNKKNSKKEAYEKLIEMSRNNNDYTAGNLLDFSYHQNYYKLIRIDLLKQTNTSILQ